MTEPAALRYPMTPDDVRSLVRACLPREGDSGRKAPHGPAVLAIGAFDGVHLGHRQLISASVEDARARNATSVVVTFDPDPSELFLGEAAQPRLLSISDRVAFCSSLGVDEVMVVPFTQDFAALDPDSFASFLDERLHGVRSVHVGSNFRFGAGGVGDVEALARLGSERGFDVTAHPLLSALGEPVSSTRIRSLLLEGDVADARRLLGRCHYVRGSVAHGRGEGTSFGFPTANVCCDGRTCMPREGVYACIVTDGTTAWPSAANVGAPPTFSSHRDAFLEANLIGFEGDLYGSELLVIFVEWLRASRPFSSLDELERVVLGNIDWVRHNVGDQGVEVWA
ncbi:MAG: riboflavin biosynthesis protein RibF [Atopobiaceae bacterium]|nr:riboflavin biosynthesis protein RibF [Atopobiaceae bacterium]